MAVPTVGGALINQPPRKRSTEVLLWTLPQVTVSCVKLTAEVN